MAPRSLGGCSEAPWRQTTIHPLPCGPASASAVRITIAAPATRPSSTHRRARRPWAPAEAPTPIRCSWKSAPPGPSRRRRRRPRALAAARRRTGSAASGPSIFASSAFADVRRCESLILGLPAFPPLVHLGAPVPGLLAADLGHSSRQQERVGAMRFARTTCLDSKLTPPTIALHDFLRRKPGQRRRI